MSSEQSPVVEQIVEEPSCGINTTVEQSAPCAVSAPCAMPVQDCSPCAMPVQQYATMPYDYNQCGDFNQQHVGFRQSIRNMFRRHSESSCSTVSNDWNQCQPCQPMACEPCQPVCEPCPPKPVMKKGYRTEQYQVQVPYNKKIKVACQVPSFEKKTICKQVQCERTKYVPVKVPYTKNVKETIKVPTTKTVYKTQVQKCFKTETKCRKVPYWYCEQPKPVCPPQPVCNPCEPMPCNPCGDSDFGMRKRDRFMNSIRRPFEAIDDKWDQFEDKVEDKWGARFNRRSCEYEDVYDCNRRSSSCGGKKSFWRSFFG